MSSRAVFQHTWLNCRPFESGRIKAAFHEVAEAPRREQLVVSLGLLALPVNLSGMSVTLIAFQVTGSAIQLLADGLSCDDKLAIPPEFRVHNEKVLTYVPGRTTRRKLFPHPILPFAIGHLGDNQRNGIPVATAIEGFLSRFSDRNSSSVRRLFQDEFGSADNSQTFCLIGYEASGHPMLLTTGKDLDRIDESRHWGGSGCSELAANWEDIYALRSASDAYVAQNQQLRPFALPFFPNNFGGHWHILHVEPGRAPEWQIPPARHGLGVSDLLPGSIDHALACSDPAEIIRNECSTLKQVLKAQFGRRVVGSLESVSDVTLRQRIARLVAVFNEVELDSSAATVEDAQRYASETKDVVFELSAV